MELSNVSKDLETLDSTEKDTKMIRTPSGNQRMLIVNESGLYSLVLKSQKTEANPKD